MSAIHTFAVGLEEAPGGATLAHALTLPGCVSAGATRDQALGAFPEALSEWLRFLAGRGEPVPPDALELEVAVDEWVVGDEGVAAGESTACFQADRLPLSDAEIATGLARIGEMRGDLLRALRGIPDGELDRGTGDWSVRRVLDELARAQWWTLTRLGASPLAEVPTRTVARLDTAMALVIQRFTELSPAARALELELDGEVWTPRKVMRRLLWLEWTLGRSARRLLTRSGAAA